MHLKLDCIPFETEVGTQGQPGEMNLPLLQNSTATSL